MIKIGLLPLYSKKRASSRYRLFQFLDSLRQEKYKISVLPAPECNPWKRLFYLFRLFPLAATYDSLLIQKRILPYWVMRILIFFGPHLVYDLDEAIYVRPKDQRKVDYMIRMVDIVIVGNTTLADYARKLNPRVVVIPTVVDTMKYQLWSTPRHPGDERIIIGWIGSDPNRGDLEPLRPVFDWLADHYGDRVVFRSIGSRPLDMETRLRLEFVRWTLDDYLDELQKFDIGIMPLDDTPWNRGKCGFKLIQYMAVGTAPIASPIGINQEIIQAGVNGFLAKDQNGWQEALSILIEDEVKRAEIGQAARVRIENAYSVASVLPKLLDTLNPIKGIQDHHA